MKQVSIKSAYTNAKQTGIAFWAERLADGLLTEEQERIIVSYKAKLVSDYVTVTKQKREDARRRILELSNDLRQVLETGFFETAVDYAYQYEQGTFRKDLTCVKRRVKTPYEKLSKCLFELGVDNDEIRLMVEQWINAHTL